MINDSVPRVEATEIYFVMLATKTNVISPTTAKGQKQHVITPAKQDIPFPPLNFRKIGKRCPKIAKVP